MPKGKQEQSRQEAPAPAPAKKGLPVKSILVVLVMLVLEGAAIVGVMTIMGRPSEVAAVGIETDPALELERIVEIPVLHEKFTNSSQGRVWIWDTEVIVQAKAMHAEGVKAQIEEKEALIRTGVSRIIAAAQHAYFNEPGRETLTRQIHDFLDKPEVIGTDPEGNPKIKHVLVPSCIGFPADY